MQEVGLAPNNTVFYGSITIDLYYIFQVVMWMAFKRLAESNYPLFLAMDRLRAMWIHHGVRQREEKDRLRLLQDKIRSSDRFATTNEHDRLYAMLGYWRHDKELDRLPDLLRPDYSRPAEHAFRDATRFMILESKSLVVFGYHKSKPTHPNPHEFPSWVTGWFRYHDSNTDTRPFGAEHFNATRGSQVQDEDFADTAHPDYIFPTGIHVDQVVEVLPQMTREVFHDGDRLLTSLITASRYPHSGMTLIAEANWEGATATEEDAQDLHTFIRYLQSGGFPHLDMYSADNTTRQGSRYHRALMHSAANRPFFTTSAGRTGLGPSGTMAGDQVVLLRGSECPIVLRKSGSEYRLVGTSYVNGIMLGEAWKGDQDAQMETFKIG